VNFEGTATNNAVEPGHCVPPLELLFPHSTSAPESDLP
jgi:hypothetical protein